MSGLGWLTAGLVVLGCVLGPATPDAEAPGLRIDVDLGPPATVRALAPGGAAAGLTYRLVVVREGRSGRSQSSQSGAVGLSDTLAVSRVNVVPGDRLAVELVLRDGDTVVDSVGWNRIIGT